MHNFIDLNKATMQNKLEGTPYVKRRLRSYLFCRLQSLPPFAKNVQQPLNNKKYDQYSKDNNSSPYDNRVMPMLVAMMVLV
jgi:hypothetical protein